MQKTEIYQFNLIEGSDPFSQEPINENTAAMEAVLAGLPKIQSGSYVGTGTVGEGSPNSLTFDFVPKLVVFDLGAGYHAAFPYVWGGGTLPVAFINPHATGQTAILYDNNVVSVEGSTMTWYAEGFSAGGQEVQLNAMGKTYRWVAVG